MASGSIVYDVYTWVYVVHRTHYVRFKILTRAVCVVYVSFARRCA